MPVIVTGLTTNLPLAHTGVLVDRQFSQSTRPPGVELVRTYPDLRSQSNLTAIIKPCAGIGHQFRGLGAQVGPLPPFPGPGGPQATIEGPGQARVVSSDI